MNNMDVTVVVVTHNRASLLAGALETLVNQETDGKLSYEILVINDGSTDETASVVQIIQKKNLAFTLRYIYQEWGGIARARNTGFENARGQWIAYFDDDQLAEPRWLAELYRVAKENNAYCVCGSRYLKMDTSLRLGLGPKSRAILGESTLPDGTIRPAIRRIPTTGNGLIHTSVFKKVGKFDTTLMRSDDWDFFWRVVKSGFTIFYAPEAKVHHVIPAYRATLPHLREICTKDGFDYACMQFKYGRAKRLSLATLWRISVFLGRDMPTIIIFGILGYKPLLTDGLCALWYSLGFIRRSFDILVHNWFYRPSR